MSIRWEWNCSIRSRPIVTGRTTIASSYANQLHAKSDKLEKMHDLTTQAIENLYNNGDLMQLGDLMHQAWINKRSLSNMVSNSQVDEIYETARKAGALGGKLTGAGGGGFMLFFAPPNKHEEIKRKLEHLICVPFQFESAGSQIIFVEPEQVYSQEVLTRVRQTFSQSQASS